MKYSAALWLGADRILILERANGKAKLMEVDMSKATNLLAKAYENTLQPEETVASSPYMQTGLATLGIVPASVREVFSTDELVGLVQQTADQTGSSPTYEIKLEGMALIDDQNLYLTNDNDFGIADPTLGSKVWKVTLKNKLIWLIIRPQQGNSSPLLDPSWEGANSLFRNLEIYLNLGTPY